MTHYNMGIYKINNFKNLNYYADVLIENYANAIFVNDLNDFIKNTDVSLKNWLNNFRKKREDYNSIIENIKDSFSKRDSSKEKDERIFLLRDFEMKKALITLIDSKLESINPQNTIKKLIQNEIKKEKDSLCVYSIEELDEMRKKKEKIDGDIFKINNLITSNFSEKAKSTVKHELGHLKAALECDSIFTTMIIHDNYGDHIFYEEQGDIKYKFLKLESYIPKVFAETNLRNKILSRNGIIFFKIDKNITIEKMQYILISGMLGDIDYNKKKNTEIIKSFGFKMSKGINDFIRFKKVKETDFFDNFVKELNDFHEYFTNQKTLDEKYSDYEKYKNIKYKKAPHDK